MISRLRGQVLTVALDHVVLDVGGVGLTVHTTPAVLAELSSGTRRTWPPCCWCARTP